MSCGCGCGGPGISGSPPAWTSTQLPDVGGSGCSSNGKAMQPGRAPGRGRGRGWPWWLWILIALVGYRLLKGSA